MNTKAKRCAWSRQAARDEVEPEDIPVDAKPLVPLAAAASSALFLGGRRHKRAERGDDRFDPWAGARNMRVEPAPHRRHMGRFAPATAADDARAAIDR